MKQQPEYQLQVAICNYIELQYPKVLFMSDTIASLRLTIPQQVRNKKIQKRDFKTPDLLIFEPKGEYHGLFIELKVSEIYKKDGTLRANPHVEEQYKTLTELNKKGYKAVFATGWDETKKIIDEYLQIQ